MKCWHCDHELIWAADHDIEVDEIYVIVTNLHCPECYCAVDVYHPSEKLKKEYEDAKKKIVN